MRKVLFLVMAFLLISLHIQAQDLDTEIVKPKEQFAEQLAHSTLAVYHGEQTCAWDTETVFIFTIDVWKCKFEEKFTCTATVIGEISDNQYIAITAGHCFDWKEEDKYYVADSTVGKPVMHKATLLKFENDDRYDYGVLAFKSMRDYAPIAVATSEAQVPSIGTEVINVNFSYGIVKEYAEGKIVSEQIQGDAGGRCEVCKGRYLVSIGMGPGASGSAVVDAHTHEIVGIAEAIFPGTQMPTVVIPMGSNFTDFFDDDSAGIKPMPEGPKPKEGDKPESESGFGRFLSRFFRFFFIL
jgi:Trypsin-like peptidase domain